MTPAPIPANDDARVSALRALLLLDTPPEQRFDRIVAFAIAEFGVPTAMISLVDRQRQWFKSRIGLDACELPRETSFCGHAILSPEPLVVADAGRDPRFTDNPLVLGPPFIRFYAGAPLLLRAGYAVGTLCLLDTRPRQMDATDLAILCSLRDLVVEELEGRAQGAADDDTGAARNPAP